MAEAHDLGARSKLPGGGFEVVVRAGMRIDDIDRSHGVTETLTLLLPGRFVAGMIVRKHEDFVSGAQVETAGYQVTRLAGIPRDHDLLGTHSQEIGQLASGGFLDIEQAGAKSRIRLPIEMARSLVHGFKHGRGRRAQVSGVQNRNAWRHDELLPDRSPEIVVDNRRRSKRFALAGKGRMPK